MCGIAGRINFNKSHIDGINIQKMCNTLRHRGPDDEGIWINKTIGLGHRRLSIIDLSGGHQPMPNEDESIFIVFNGEIYNFKEIREGLVLKGHKFKTNSDTETILHLYEEAGASCIKRLRGMFAFAIWDNNKDTLLLARDRIGKKPLFYYIDNDKFVFASEIKAINIWDDLEKEIDLPVVDEFLRHQFIPAPRTIYRYIKKLLPGHYAILKADRLSLHKYWDLPLPNVTTKKDIKTYIEELDYQIRDAVKVRLISDVPLGAFLSGGIDSSAVVAYMRNILGRPVKTFSISFKEKSYDEAMYARTVSNHLGTEHKEFLVEYDIEGILPSLIDFFDEPFGDSSFIPTYFLSKMTREYVTVSLSGDGGDETFSGYKRYIGRRLIKYYLSIPSFIRKGVLEKIVSIFPEPTDYYGKSIIKQANLFINQVARIKEDSIDVLPHTFSYDELDRLYKGDIQSYISSYRKDNRIREISLTYKDLDEISHMMWTDINTYLPDDILVKVDRMSMANSLEVRCPFLDHNLIEFLATIPIDIKLKGLTTKYILKKTIAGMVPEVIIRRKKQGFVVPLAKWFKDRLKDFAYTAIFNSKGLEMYNHNFLEEIWKEHQQGIRDHSQKLWLIMVLNLWFLNKK